jgi:hypothetical protein
MKDSFLIYLSGVEASAEKAPSLWPFKCLFLNKSTQADFMKAGQLFPRF